MSGYNGHEADCLCTDCINDRQWDTEKTQIQHTADDLRRDAWDRWQEAGSATPHLGTSRLHVGLLGWLRGSKQED